MKKTIEILCIFVKLAFRYNVLNFFKSMRYKYIILFIIFFHAIVFNKTFSQISVLVKVETSIPTKSYAQEYGVGYGVGGGFTTEQLGRGTFAIHATYNVLPGKSVSDEHLMYDVSNLVYVPCNLEFTYMLWHNVHVSVEGGPTGYFKPEKSLGSNGAVGLMYGVGRLSVGGKIRHIRHGGYMNVFAGQIQYRLF